MRLTLSIKLILAFVFISVFGVIAMVTVLRYFANRSFEEYVEKREMSGLVGLQARLEKYYQKHGGWQDLRNDPESWSDMIGDELKASGYLVPAARPLPPIPPVGPEGRPLPGPLNPNAPPPPRGLGPAGGVRPAPFPGYGNAAPMRDIDQHRGPEMEKLFFRLGLFDEHKRLVAGREPDPARYSLMPIQVQERTVGYLGLHKAPPVKNSMDQEFVTRQIWTLYLAGALIILVSCVLALFLARGLSRPIKELARAADLVAARNFGTRVEVQTTDEIGRLAAAFNQMAEKLGEYERRQSQWVSDIAHELRNPLAILIGEIEAIQDGVRKPGPEGMASLHAEASRLNKIVADLRVLSLADMGELPLEMQRIDPVQVLLDCLDRPRSGLAADGIEVRTELDAGHKTISGDHDRLTQVFANVIENAHKYAARPATLTVSSRLAGGRIVIAIEDSGPGVPDAALPRLFDRLYRVDESRSRATGGSGLGLAIVKSIVEGHGGTVSARRAASGGLRIELEFPIG